MQREEVKKILRIIVDSYPNYKPTNMSETIDIWEMMLEEYTYQEISLALKSYILSDISGFAPAIGQLTTRVHETRRLLKNEEVTDLEAWALVYKAICNSGYNYESEYAKLPPIIQRAIGHPVNLKEWASMDVKTVQSVEQSHFIRVYRAELERARKIEVAPLEVRQMLSSTEKKSIEHKGDD